MSTVPQFKNTKFEVICHTAHIMGMRGCYNKNLKHIVLALESGGRQNLKNP